MIMIRNTMLGLSLLALTSASAFAAAPKTVVTHHSTRTVAQGEAAPAPSTDKPAKKEKKAKKEKAPKAEGAKTEGAKDMKAPETK
jgi:hypothetical protein